MLGFSNFGIALVYTLCIASALLCVIYGIINWNKGKDREHEELEAKIRWKEKEKSIQENL
ncbi:MAG: hypothetical protein GX115_04575 [Ruminiclostridium sp.]|nr:hypothetical protein [Ruminiclostridium sp.]